MSFKILANIDGKIQHFSIPFILNRNGYIEDKINEVYFSEKNINAKKNENLYINYIENISEDEYFIEQFEKYKYFIKKSKEEDKPNFIGSSLFLTHYFEEKERIIVSNMMYNMMIKTFENWILNLFMIVGKLPNLEDEASAFILKKSNLKEFFDKIEIVNKEDDFIFNERYSSDLNILIEYYKAGSITDDVIITHEFYFSDEIEMACGYGDPDEVLLSLEFQQYLRDNKGEFIGFDYNEIVESYIEEQNVTMDSNLLMKGYKSYIEANSLNRVYIDINECKELNFIHNEIIEKLKK